MPRPRLTTGPHQGKCVRHLAAPRQPWIQGRRLQFKIVRFQSGLAQVPPLGIRRTAGYNDASSALGNRRRFVYEVGEVVAMEFRS